MADTHKLQKLAKDHDNSSQDLGNDRLKLKNADMKQQGSFTKILVTFLEGTTAHGLPRVVTSESKARKLSWLLIFCLAFAYFTYQCTMLVNQYRNYPISVRINVVTS